MREATRRPSAPRLRLPLTDDRSWSFAEAAYFLSVSESTDRNLERAFAGLHWTVEHMAGFLQVQCPRIPFTSGALASAGASLAKELRRQIAAGEIRVIRVRRRSTSPQSRPSPERSHGWPTMP